MRINDQVQTVIRKLVKILRTNLTLTHMGSSIYRKASNSQSPIFINMFCHVLVYTSGQKNSRQIEPNHFRFYFIQTNCKRTSYNSNTILFTNPPWQHITTLSSDLLSTSNLLRLVTLNLKDHKCVFITSFITDRAGYYPL